MTAHVYKAVLLRDGMLDSGIVHLGHWFATVWYCSHVDFLMFLQSVQLECFFAHETSSIFASVLGTVNVFF